MTPEPSNEPVPPRPPPTPGIGQPETYNRGPIQALVYWFRKLRDRRRAG